MASRCAMCNQGQAIDVDYTSQGPGTSWLGVLRLTRCRSDGLADRGPRSCAAAQFPHAGLRDSQRKAVSAAG